jgi:cullin 1
MKARKTMKNQPLIQEVISQISQRFTPKIPDIKKVCFRLPLLLNAQNN